MRPEDFLNREMVEAMLLKGREQVLPLCTTPEQGFYAGVMVAVQAMAAFEREA